MSYRKKTNNGIDSARNSMMSQSRRLDDVKRNFAVGTRQVVVAAISNKETHYKAKANKEV